MSSRSRPSLHIQLSRLPTSLLVALALPASAAALPGFWHDIYYAPTPSPEDGPPLSAHASRDKRLLPYQICGILGAYIGFVLIALVLLLTVGRRLRRRTESSPSSLEMEIFKPTKRATDDTPISPASTTRSWFKGFKKPSSVRSDSNPASPTVQSVGSFDQIVLDKDAASRQRDMEMLYAAVMEHDAKKHGHDMIEERSVEESNSEEEIRPTSRGKLSKRPPAISTMSAEGRRLEPASPRSPMKSIYPPQTARYDRQPMSPGPQARYAPSAPTSPMGPPPMSPRKVPSSPRSILSIGSTGSKTKKALKNLRISAPIQKYPGDKDDEARAPLSPRLYPNPPAPPSPPHDGGRSPTTPGEAYEALDEVQPLPNPRPTRSPLSPGLPVPQTLSLPPKTPGSLKSAGTSSSSLPLRSYATGDSAIPPTPTKTTYVERRMDKLSLTSPRTGVPATPYSAYMPFTPITPVSARLVTKKEMKAKKKAEGKRVMSGDDLVQNADDMWDSGY
jgi:hypothetical protein